MLLRRCLLLLGVAVFLVAAASSSVRATQQAAAPGAAVPGSANRELVNKYCISCHSERLKTAGIVLEGANPDDPSANLELWEKVVRKVNARVMPPVGMPRPDEAVTAAFVESLQSRLDRVASVRRNPGRPLVRRVNRTEYANAVRDLLDLDVDVAGLLPPDDSSFGFDNSADVLGVNPALLERYVSASFKISEMAMGDPTLAAKVQTYRPRPDLSQERHIEELPVGTRGGLLIKHYFPLDAEYVIKATLWKDTVHHIRGLEFEHQLEVTIDGARVKLASFGGKADENNSYENQFEAALDIEKRFDTRVALKAGLHTIGIAFVEKNSGPGDELFEPFTRPLDPVNAVGNPHVDTASIAGPFEATGSGDTPARRRVLVCTPARDADQAACARRIITGLARRAYRREPTAADVDGLVAFYERGRARSGFEAGIQLALARVLASPQFVFRFEPDRSRPQGGDVYRVSDTELASRLSFFLWSSIPDDELLRAAAQGQLRSAAGLERQVKRMLADPRARTLVTNFAGQWLYLRNLRSAQPDAFEFPNFDDNLRQAFLRETEMFVQSIIDDDRSVVDLLTANYTFLNERLARHYGVKGIYGARFRRVTLTDDRRFGLLGQGSVLLVTSHANRTSPVLRGKWILTNVLGTPPPPPPPNIPALKEADKTRPTSARERMEAHRASPYCASCHRVIDPIGFSLENFDATGAWRDTEDGAAIDTSGMLASGQQIEGPQALRRALAARPELFVGTMVEKLMTYALGRGVEPADMPALRAVLSDAAPNRYRFSSLILGIVNSTPFQYKTVPPESDAVQTAAAR